MMRTQTHFDLVVVGAGIYGCTFARVCKDAGLSVLVIDKRNHIGGNCYDYKDNETKILVHKYGAHVFRTSDEEVWQFLNRFTNFKKYVHEVKVNYNNKIYSMPFNMNTFHELWGVETVEQAKKLIEEKTAKYQKENPANLEEQALKLAGEEIYNIFIKGYSEKQWGKLCTEIPADTMRRIKFRYEWNNDYFTETHEGIPTQGYTKMFTKMLDGIELLLDCDYRDYKDYFNKTADKIVYCGRIDELFDKCFGELEYRTLSFDIQTINKEYFQQTAVTNYTDKLPAYTRTIEHKHFLSQKCRRTVVSYEYPEKFKANSIPFYCVNNDKNNKLYLQYKEKLAECPKIMVGGILGKYQYKDMQEIVRDALNDAKQYLKEIRK